MTVIRYQKISHPRSRSQLWLLRSY